MPTLAEFSLKLHLRHDEATGTTWTVFRFTTARQFTSFRYEIDLDSRLDPAAHTIDFRIRGVHAPLNLMPGTGAAEKEVSYPGLDGTYEVAIAGAKQSGGFSFSVNGDELRILRAAESDLLSVTAATEIELLRQ